MEYWPQLERKLPSYFEGVKVRPSLLHGDLWSGNVAETDTGPGTYGQEPMKKYRIFFSWAPGTDYSIIGLHSFYISINSRL